ncbi:hypothetical protein ABBQ32_007253 [Trebouxia sp. C0010 RCD-2024]
MKLPQAGEPPPTGMQKSLNEPVATDQQQLEAGNLDGNWGLRQLVKSTIVRQLKCCLIRLRPNRDWLARLNYHRRPGVAETQGAPYVAGSLC